MARTQDSYKKALHGKKIPLLVLDHKWHQLFTQVDAILPPEVRRQEDRLNELIRRQGKLNTESKSIRQLKKRLMAEIIELSEAFNTKPDPKLEKALEENRRLVNECNDKLEENTKELKQLPEEIESINDRLMLFTMEICYQRIDQNTKEIDQINEWVASIRMEMKKKLIRKQEKEKINFDLYSYMHDIFGADVIEVFDKGYKPEEKKSVLSGSNKI